MGQTWQDRGVGTPVYWLPQLWIEHRILWDAGHLLLDVAFVSTCMHFQIVAYERNAKFSWGKVSGSENWRWTPLLMEWSVSLFRKSCRIGVKWVSAVLHAKLVQNLKTRHKKHLHLIGPERVLSGLLINCWCLTTPREALGSCYVTSKI